VHCCSQHLSLVLSLVHSSDIAIVSVRDSLISVFLLHETVKRTIIMRIKDTKYFIIGQPQYLLTILFCLSYINLSFHLFEWARVDQSRTYAKEQNLLTPDTKHMEKRVTNEKGTLTSDSIANYYSDPDTALHSPEPDQLFPFHKGSYDKYYSRGQIVWGELKSK